jgi:hypothetical protein
MGAPYIRESNAPDTQFVSFRPVREQKAGLGADGAVDDVTGKSVISRWFGFAVDHDDFVSNPDATGYIAKCPIPRGTTVIEVAARVDTAFEAAGPAGDIDIGDGNDSDGWADGLDFSSSAILRDADAAYNDPTADPSDGSAGWQWYEDGDTLDVLWKNGTAPTAGEAVIMFKTFSYHEAAGAEW